MWYLRKLATFGTLILQSGVTPAETTNFNIIMYLTGQHNVVPEFPMVSEVSHVALAFMPSSIFNEPSTPRSWPLFTTVDAVRERFPSETKIMVAIGGWGDTRGFSDGAATETGRKVFARNIRAMVDATGADGVDVDWEYPGGNGEDYKQIPNSQKAEEIHNYPLLLSAIRQALGPNKIISAAVPGIHRDMLAFTPETVPQLSRTLDFLNVMTYDLMNRRDNVTKHHTGVQLSLEAIDLYERRGFPASKMNLGFAFYIKWFRTDPEFGEQCSANPIGCKTVLMEDPVTGADLGQAGAFSWHDPVPEELKGSYRKAMKHGKYDITGGGHYYWDSEEHLWWTWDTPEAVSKKIPEIVRGKKLGGVFAWGLGEDAPDFKHYEALRNAIFEQEDHESKDEL